MTNILFYRINNDKLSLNFIKLQFDIHSCKYQAFIERDYCLNESRFYFALVKIVIKSMFAKIFERKLLSGFNPIQR